MNKMSRQNRLRAIRIEEAKIKASQLKIRKLRENDEDEDEDSGVFDYMDGSVELGKILVTPRFKDSNGADEWTGPGYPPFRNLRFKSSVGDLVIKDLRDEDDDVYAKLNGEELDVLGEGEETTVFENDDYVVFFTVCCRGDFRTYTVIYDKSSIPDEVIEEIEDGNY